MKTNTYVSGSILGAEDTPVDKTYKVPVFMEII